MVFLSFARSFVLSVFLLSDRKPNLARIHFGDKKIETETTESDDSIAWNKFDLISVHFLDAHTQNQLPLKSPKI